MACDTGNPEVMNNPATPGMMEEGSSEIDIGIHGRHPDVSLDFGGMTTGSDGGPCWMPSLSFMHRDGTFSLRPEVGMGRLMLPIAMLVIRDKISCLPAVFQFRSGEEPGSEREEPHPELSTETAPLRSRFCYF